jgi:DNA topoisomerase-1
MMASFMQSPLGIDRLNLYEVSMGRALKVKTLSPEKEAEEAGLNYVSLNEPGFSRKRRGKTFYFIDTKGSPIRDKSVCQRIKSLVIPPAWEQVWISPDPKGHIQATGRDAKGRKQYRYHARWRTQRDGSKFDKMVAFAKALPTIRRQVQKGLGAGELSKQQIVCTVIHLLETTLVRIGNESYAKSNKSYGLTTIRAKHVEIKSSSVRFAFKGKSGVMHDVKLSDRKIARIISRCHSLPGQLLFQYRDDGGETRPVGSTDVNQLLQEICGHPFSAKDFRTWCASVMAVKVLRDFEAPQSQTHGKKTVKAAISEVAKALRNTVTVCKKCYVHPQIIDFYLAGDLHRKLRAAERKRIAAYQKLGLDSDEAYVLALLDHGSFSSAKQAA